MEHLWTTRDTEICIRAEASGKAINLKTGNPLTLDEIKILHVEFDKVRSSITIDEFLKDKVGSIPFNF